jgi:hypothetical protein
VAWPLGGGWGGDEFAGFATMLELPQLAGGQGTGPRTLAGTVIALMHPTELPDFPAGCLCAWLAWLVIHTTHCVASNPHLVVQSGNTVN